MCEAHLRPRVARDARCALGGGGDGDASIRRYMCAAFNHPVACVVQDKTPTNAHPAIKCDEIKMRGDFWDMTRDTTNCLALGWHSAPGVRRDEELVR